MGHAGVAAHHSPGSGDGRRQLEQARAAGQDRGRRQACLARHPLGQAALGGRPGDHDVPAGFPLGARHRRPAVRRPAARFAGRAGMHDRGAGGRRRNLGGREPQVGRIRRDPGLAEQAAPPLDLVFARSPRDAAAPEGDQAAGPGGLEDLVALRAATVEVDG